MIELCPTVAEMGVRLWHVCSWCARWRILRCGGFAAILQLRNECTGLPNGTRLPKSGFAVAKLPAEWGFGCENWEFLRFGILQPFHSCEMVLVCQKLVSQLQNTLRNGALAGCFAAAKPPFGTRVPFGSPIHSFHSCEMAAKPPRLKILQRAHHE